MFYSLSNGFYWFVFVLFFVVCIACLKVVIACLTVLFSFYNHLYSSLLFLFVFKGLYNCIRVCIVFYLRFIVVIKICIELFLMCFLFIVFIVFLRFSIVCLTVMCSFHNGCFNGIYSFFKGVYSFQKVFIMFL